MVDHYRAELDNLSSTISTQPN